MITAKTVQPNRDEVTYYFNTWHECLYAPNFDEFVFLNIKNSSLVGVFDRWPRALQVLNCANNKIEELCNLPSSLRILNARINRIQVFPDISHCTQLESIDLYDNHIVDIDIDIPETVFTLDISFNKIRNINYSKLAPNLMITASYNFLTERPPAPFNTTMDYDHNEIKYSYYTPPRYRMTRHEVIRPAAKVYDNAQNVHATSIQGSANTSLEYVLSYKPAKAYDDDYIANIGAAYKRYKLRNINWLLKLFYVKSTHNSLPLASWCNDPTVLSIHGCTYNTLLKQVWALIQDHEHREELEMILCEELEASLGMCLTGRFTRTLNALTGFVEQVNIGISKSEQMQNRIAKAVESARKTYKEPCVFVKAAKGAVADILVEFGVPEEERDAWLDAIV